MSYPSKEVRCTRIICLTCYKTSQCLLSILFLWHCRQQQAGHRQGTRPWTTFEPLLGSMSLCALSREDPQALCRQIPNLKLPPYQVSWYTPISPNYLQGWVRKITGIQKLQINLGNIGKSSSKQNSHLDSSLRQRLEWPTVCRPPLLNVAEAS
jgi:hypothetical protein